MTTPSSPSLCSLFDSMVLYSGIKELCSFVGVSPRYGVVDQPRGLTTERHIC